MHVNHHHTSWMKFAWKTYLWISVNRIWMRIWLIASWHTVSLNISHHSIAWWYNGRCQCFLQLLLLLSIFCTTILKPNLHVQRIIARKRTKTQLRAGWRIEATKYNNDKSSKIWTLWLNSIQIKWKSLVPTFWGESTFL